MMILELFCNTWLPLFQIKLVEMAGLVAAESSVSEVVVVKATQGSSSLSPASATVFSGDTKTLERPAIKGGKKQFWQLQSLLITCSTCNFFACISIVHSADVACSIILHYHPCISAAASYNPMAFTCS